MSTVVFNNSDIEFQLPQKRLLKAFIKMLFDKESVLLHAIAYTFCSDDYLLKMNSQFLQHDFYTDILTFDLSDNEKTTGDIYISIDRVKENALTHQISTANELLRVIFHGALHLCGYNDKTKKDKFLMTQKEDEYLELYKTFHVES